MYKLWLKTCSIILVVTLCINMLPMTVFAQEFRENISATEQAALVEAEDAYIVREITENRTEFSKEFQLSNGLRMAAVYADAVHYETENGWEDIDNTLVAKADGTYANTAGVWDVRFPSQLTKTQGVTIEKDGYTLSFYMAGELNSNHELMSATEPVTVESQAVLTETIPETTTPPLTEPTAETIEIIPEATAETVSETVTEAFPVETVAETLALETLPTITEIPETTAPVQATVPILEQLPEISTETLTLAEVSLSTATVHEMDTAALKAAFAYEEMAPEKNHSRLSYSNVFPNTQIVYDLDANKVKESIVLDSYKSSLRGYRYTLHTGEMLPVLEESGQILFYDKAQENIVMVMPAPYLVDDAGEYNSDIRVSLTGSSGTYTLTYTLPVQWLAAQDRAWPVILDPCVAPALTTSNIHDQTVSQKRSLDRTWGILDAGYSTADGITRFFLQYKNLPTITSSDVIVAASIQLYKPQTSTTSAPVEVHKVNSTWEASTITWSNKPAFNTNIEDYAIVKDSGHYSWSITDLVREWYTGQNTGMMFKVSDAVETGGTQNYKQFYSSDYTENDEYQPILVIAFRNNNGIEGAWDYSVSSAGRAGTGYVNNYTGNLVWARMDMGFNGNLMPVTITSVYNANDAFQPNDTTNSNDTAGNSFGMGNGWRTNYNQLVYQWEVDGQTQGYYIWEDEDGTDHYFEYSSPNTYTHEVNKNVILRTDGSGSQKYSITFENGYINYFDTLGRLTVIRNNQETPSEIEIEYDGNSRRIINIEDGANRVYNFVYNENDLLSRIRYLGAGTTELSYVSFTYAGNNPTTVTYKDAEICSYSYDDNNILLTAQDIDGYTLTYTYHPRGSDTWKPYRVASVTETDETTGGSLSFVYGHNQTTITDHNENVNILQFNDFGNMTSIQDDEGRAQFAEFAFNTDAEEAENTDPTKKKNQLRVASQLQTTVVNLLSNSSFENASDWISGDSELTASQTASEHYLGNHSLMLVTESENSVPVQTDSIFIQPGETYTLSAFVKTDTNAVVSIAMQNNDTYLITIGDQLKAEKDWTRLQVSYTNNTEETIEMIPSLFVTSDDDTDTIGTAYVDCVQLEKDVSASRYNLIENGDFLSTGTSQDLWARESGLASTDTVISATAATSSLNNNVYSITGSSAGCKRISQEVSISGNTGDSFVFAGWAKGNSAPLDYDKTREREFAIRAKFNYTDGTSSDYFTAQFNPDSNAWQYAAGAMVAKKPYSGIQFQFAYDYNVNTVYFDGAQLYKEAFGNTYTYDADGKVISAKDLQAQTTTYEYDTNSNLTKIIQNNKAKMTYIYDDWHNVEKATTVEGVTYTFEYDTYGNNESVSIEAGENMPKITSSATYTNGGNTLASTTDALGKTTTYGYNKNTNVLDWVEYPENAEDAEDAENTVGTKTSYTYDSMYRVAETAANVKGINDSTQQMWVKYTYEDDLRKSIETPTTTYDFAYGDFGLRSSVKIGQRTLAEYSYTTDQNNYLSSIDYGNNGSVEYKYDNKGRLIKQTYEDGDTVAYSYDSRGARAKVYDSATGITTTNYYDFTGRLMKYIEKGSGRNHSVGYVYNEKNNLTELAETFGNTTRTTTYDYDEDNRVKSITNGAASITYAYDAYGRLTQTVSETGQTLARTETFSFVNPTADTTSSQIARYTVDAGMAYEEFDYTYDENGNIATIDNGYYTTTYTYDTANQLLSEDAPGRYRYEWTYDDAGNIQSRKKYTYQAGQTELVLSETVNYGYDDTWGDLLDSYNGRTITYDNIGNPTNDGVWRYEWEHGRELASMTEISTGTAWTYAYDANGMRTQRTNGTKTYKYFYNGSQLTRMTADGHTLYFTYDASGRPWTVTMDDELYYYVTNLQGDVLYIVDEDGIDIARYNYTAWGECTLDGSHTLAILNPLRYRGYVYDPETELYYLQSRYYNPEIGRFINADGLVSTGQGVLDNNMFAYCEGNPISYSDSSGNARNYCVMLTDAGKKPLPKVDITEKLNTAMEENAATLRDYKKKHGFPNAVTYFVDQVKPGGDWDFKSQDSWALNADTAYTYNGEYLRYDDIGNIHYGYVGRVLFDEKTLLLAGGVVQLYAGTSDFSYWQTNFDDPRDQWAISFGCNIWDMEELS